MTRRIYKRPHRAKRKKPFFAKAIFWKSTATATLALGAVWFICFSPTLEIREVAVNGTDRVNKSDCVKAIEQQINKKIALFDSKSILLFNIDQAKKDLLAQFPQIQDIKIERQFPSKIYAAVQERRAVAVFSTGQGKQYSIDGDGIAFEVKGVKDANLLQIVSNRVGDSELKIGGTAISKDNLENILKLKGGAESQTKISITSAIIATGERVNFQTNEGWFIYFNPTKDAEVQLVKLVSVVNDNTFSAKRKNLEYVDIRFTRVYLKEKTSPTSAQ